MKVSGEWIEQKIGGNAHHKEAIKGLKWYLLCAVDIDVADVQFFVILLRWFFEYERQNKTKLKASGEWTEKNNCGNAHHKYATRGFKQQLPSDVAVVVADVIFFYVVAVIPWNPDPNENETED